jgi:hypothetical protein
MTKKENTVVEDVAAAGDRRDGGVVGSAGFVLFVLRREFHRDPRVSASSRALTDWGPEVVSVAAAPAGANQTARYYKSAFRSDTIEIVLPARYGNESNTK